MNNIYIILIILMSVVPGLILSIGAIIMNNAKQKQSEKPLKESKTPVFQSCPFNETYIIPATQTLLDLIKCYELAGSPAQAVKNTLHCKDVHTAINYIYGTIPVTTAQYHDILRCLSNTFHSADRTDDEIKEFNACYDNLPI